MSVKPNALFTGDNLYILSGMNSDSIDLIYLDPPFNSKRLYKAPIGSRAAGASFKDMWTWGDVDDYRLEALLEPYSSLFNIVNYIGEVHSTPMAAYVVYMAQRLTEMRRILKPTGSIYLHCDPTASHYLKLLMDMIFGRQNFQNEIVWWYSWGKHTDRYWNKKHDIILYYSKDHKQVYFDGNKARIPYRKGSVMTTNPKYNKKYNPDGKLPEDVFDIPTINGMSKERTGYPTQKPLALMNRIIRAASKEGDLVLDPFCGCATTCVQAQILRRKWIGIDLSEKAAELVQNRLSGILGLIFKDFVHIDVAKTGLPKRSDAKKTPLTANTKERLVKDYGEKCNGCGVEFEARNLQIDHIIPRAKGGGDYYENYQLLCGNCNSIKGARPMEYLRAKIKRRVALMGQEITFGR